MVHLCLTKTAGIILQWKVRVYLPDSVKGQRCGKRCKSIMRESWQPFLGLFHRIIPSQSRERCPQDKTSVFQGNERHHETLDLWSEDHQSWLTHRPAKKQVRLLKDCENGHQWLYVKIPILGVLTLKRNNPTRWIILLLLSFKGINPTYVWKNERF